MTWIQILVLVVSGVFFLMVVMALIGWLCPGPDYMPMSSDKEYQWLTEDMGLSHDEAMEIVNSPWPK